MQYDAIVIGSGFGGTIATTVLAQANKRMLVLERGGWWVSPMPLGSPPPTPPMLKWLKQAQDDLKAEGKDPKELVHFWPRPDHAKGVIDLVASIKTRFNPTGLYNYHRFDEVHVPTANGVGGGSLIYSNVTIKPEADVLAHIGLDLDDDDFSLAQRWMAHFRGPTNSIVTKVPFLWDELEPDVNVRKAKYGIGDLADLDDDHDYLYLDKSRALKNAARELSQQRGVDMPWRPLQLSVIEYDPLRKKKLQDGTEQPASAAAKARTHCERQGRCLFGCLPQARHTLNKTLYGKVLTDQALGQFVTLQALAEVNLVRRLAEGGFEVTYSDGLDGGREASASAPLVFLAAGTLGTSELLLRCQQAGALNLSPALGYGFSTNGDFGGFAILPQEAHPVYSSRGPINTCEVSATARVRDRDVRITVEDAGLPAIIAEVASIGLAILDEYLSDLRGLRGFWAKVKRLLFKWRLRWLFWHFGRHLHRFHHRLPHFLPKAKPDKRRSEAPAKLEPRPPFALPDTTDPHRYETEAEMVSRIFFFNTMSEDDANGRFSLRGDKLDLKWDTPVTDHPVFDEIEKLQSDLAEAMGGSYLPMPLWRGFAKKVLVLPHPLGGCRIAPNREQGTINEWGQVFDGDGRDGSDVHDGLYVVDGSAVPGALAVNPTLTISAQALKTMRHAVGDAAFQTIAATWI